MLFFMSFTEPLVKDKFYGTIKSACATGESITTDYFFNDPTILMYSV